MFPGMNCRDVPAPSEPTLPELMDNSLAYARATQERLAKELGLPREPTLRECLEESLAYAKRTQARLRMEFAEERRKRKNKR